MDEWHYTPEHGSWLNIAEIELSVLQLQCLNRRIADKEILITQTEAWEQSRNDAHTTTTTINWHFTTPYRYIETVRDHNAIGITANGTFRPAANVTRAHPCSNEQDSRFSPSQ